MSRAAHVSPWTPSSPEGRWAGFGPYYAMFPVEFVRRTVDRFCPEGGGVLDPFCGRGTSLFVAAVTGRKAIGADSNAVAWLFAAAKLDPWPTAEPLLARIGEVLDSVTAGDRRPQTEFQQFAWHRDVLGFLNSARRILNWRRNRLDRTLMAIILVHVHAKLGEGLSNQLRQSKAMAPNYSVHWWKRQGLLPPKINVIDFFRKKLDWRYKRGIPSFCGESIVRLGDSRKRAPKDR